MPETDTPFWEQTPPTGESIIQEPAEATDTGDALEVITVGGREFIRTEGVAATVTLKDDDGKGLGTIHVPYDPDHQPSEEDVFAEANRLYHDLEHMRTIVRADVVAILAQSIVTSGVSETIIGAAVDLLRGSFRLHMTDDERASKTPAELAEWGKVAREAERLYDEQVLEVGIREYVAAKKHESDPAGTFWMEYARDQVAHAVLWARDAVIDELGGPEAAQALGDDAFERLVMDAYRDGPHLTQAMLTLWQAWTRTLVESIASSSRISDDDSETAEQFNALIRAARKSLGMDATPATETPPTFTPAFDADGYGRTDNSVVSIGARRALSASPSRWGFDVEGFPVFTHENGSGKALYSPSRSHFPTARDAMRAVENYGPSQVAMLKYITAMHLANSANKTSGPYGGFYVSIDDYLGVVGRAKHAKGGYRPEDRRDVIELIEALERIEVTGSVEGYEKGKRGKKSSLTIRSPLIVVSHRVTQRGVLDGEERPVAWYLRAGDWAAELEQFGMQYAVMTKALLQLNTQNDMHAFNLGNHLTEEYRIRARQQSWKQPHRVCKLLEGAEIEVDRKHAGRFRQRIEAALDVLSNPVEMQGTPIIERWQYADVVEAKGRGWFDRWLAAGIVITPPAGFTSPYNNIGRSRRQPRKLATD